MSWSKRISKRPSIISEDFRENRDIESSKENEDNFE
jgi:hypothetical protein